MTWKRTVLLALALMMAVSASSVAFAVENDEESVDLTATALLTDEASDNGNDADSVTVVAPADSEYADFGNNLDEKYKGYGGSQYISYLTFLNYFSDIERISETITVDADTPLHSSNGAVAKEITDDFNTTKKHMLSMSRAILMRTLLQKSGTVSYLGGLSAH